MNKHTELYLGLPLRLERDSETEIFISSESHLLGVIYEQEDAEFIVKAANNHYKLLEALKVASSAVSEIVHVQQSDDDWVSCIDKDVFQRIRRLTSKASMALAIAKKDAEQ